MQFGLVLVHAFVGALLAAHGAQKLFAWFGGYGLTGTGRYLESLGFRRGRLAAAAAGSSELAGGTLFALGLVTAVAALLIASVMLVAARTDHRGKGLWIYNGGSEYVLTVSAVVIGLAFYGPGAWSLDRSIGWTVSGLWWGVGAAVLAPLAGIVVPLLGRESTPATAATAV
jgi:putative oxidoreductase